MPTLTWTEMGGQATDDNDVSNLHKLMSEVGPTFEDESSAEEEPMIAWGKNKDKSLAVLNRDGQQNQKEPPLSLKTSLKFLTFFIVFFPDF